MSYFSIVKLRNALGSIINPATEEKQDTGNWYLATLESTVWTNVHTLTPEIETVSKWHLSENNSTSTPLWINWVYTWTWEDTLDYSEIIVSVYANQPSVTDWLVIQWSSNWMDVHWDDVFTISASSWKTFSFPCQNKYVRVKYTNDWVAQTTFDLQTLLKRFASKGSSHRLKDNLVQEDDAIVTKSLIAWFSTAWGGTLQNVKVSPSWAVQVWGTLDWITWMATSANQTNWTQKTGIIDLEAGHDVYVDQFHNLQVAEATRLVGTTFNGTTKDTNFWTETVLNSASANQANWLITLTSGTNSDGSIIYQTVRKARFVPVMVNMFRAVGKMDSAIANNTRIWGMYDGIDWAWFELTGTTMNVVTKAGASSAVKVPTASWNIDSSFTMDTNFHSYEIRCWYDSYHFIIDWNLVHEISISGSGTLPSNTLTLPVYLQNINSGNTTTKDMSFVLASIYRLGKLQTAPTYKNITGVSTSQILKYGAGMIHSIIVWTPVNNATISIYDNTSGTGNLITTLTLPSQSVPIELNFHVWFSTGLNIVPSSASLNITVIYE